MNPPDYYPVPDEVLEAARLSITKVLASGNIDQKTTELLTNMLMGGEWPDNSIYKHIPDTYKNMHFAILYFLPSVEEKMRKKPNQNHYQSMHSALTYFKAYLNAPQNP